MQTDRLVGDGSGLCCYAHLVMLLGRLAELAACQKALSAEAGGSAAGAVISGPPGIGKTSLWRAVAGSEPAGVVVLRTTGVPGGQPGFANLADLLDPVVGMVLPRLPGPQAAALRAALGLAAAEMPLEEMLLERAMVAAMRGLAGPGVVIAVDDEQWVDEDTRRLLKAARGPAWRYAGAMAGFCPFGLCRRKPGRGTGA